MADSGWKEQEPASCSIHEASVFSWSLVSVGGPKKRVLISAKKHLVGKLDELASGSGAGRQKAKVSSSGSSNVGRH